MGLISRLYLVCAVSRLYLGSSHEPYAASLHLGRTISQFNSIQLAIVNAVLLAVSYGTVVPVRAARAWLMPRLLLGMISLTLMLLISSYHPHRVTCYA